MTMTIAHNADADANDFVQVMAPSRLPPPSPAPEASPPAPPNLLSPLQVVGHY